MINKRKAEVKRGCCFKLSREAIRQLADEMVEVDQQEDLWHLARDQSQLLKESYTTSRWTEERQS